MGSDVQQGNPRAEVVTVYRRARERGEDHDGAVFVALHEVRRCSEVDVRRWVSGAESAFRTMEEDAAKARAFPLTGEEARQAEVERDPAPFTPLDEARTCVAHGLRDCTMCAPPVIDDPQTASAPAEGKWVFDASVTAAFDDMLSRSIPNYSDMREITTRAASWLADRYALGGGTPLIVDIGASRGAALAPLVDSMGARAQYLAMEISEPMIEALEERFSGYIEAGIFKVDEVDLRNGFPHGSLRKPVAVTLAILTLQFIPIEYRQRLLREVYDQTSSQGGMIVVEKVLGAGYEADKLLVDLYYDKKRENGYAQEAIDRKRLALEGVLVPQTAAVNEQLLRDAGFALVEPIWAWANFRGWVAVKR